MATAYRGVIRTGAFTAMPLSMFDWRIRNDHLPEWSMTVTASERDVAHLLQLAQAEYRGLATKEKEACQRKSS